MDRNAVKTVMTLVLGVMIIWLAISLLPFVSDISTPLNGWSFEKRGQFGDMFGFTNSVFTALTFVFLIYTAFLQRKDLNKQKDLLQSQLNLQKLSAQLHAINQQIDHCSRQGVEMFREGNNEGIRMNHETQQDLLRQQSKVLACLTNHGTCNAQKNID